MPLDPYALQRQNSVAEVMAKCVPGMGNKDEYDMPRHGEGSASNGGDGAGVGPLHTQSGAWGARCENRQFSQLSSHHRHVRKVESDRAGRRTQKEDRQYSGCCMHSCKHGLSMLRCECHGNVRISHGA